MKRGLPTRTAMLNRNVGTLLKVGLVGGGLYLVYKLLKTPQASANPSIPNIPDPGGDYVKTCPDGSTLVWYPYKGEVEPTCPSTPGVVDPVSPTNTKLTLNLAAYGPLAEVIYQARGVLFVGTAAIKQALKAMNTDADVDQLSKAFGVRSWGLISAGPLSTFIKDQLDTGSLRDVYADFIEKGITRRF